MTPRAAIVTGAARRVGRAIALELARAGFDVTITYLTSEAEARAAASEIQGLGRRALAARADLTDPQAAVDRICNDHINTFGRLDVLVNNASLYLPGDLAHTSLDTLRKLNAIHVESPLLLAQRLAPLLRAARGHVVNMADLLAERPWPHYLAYCASKAALANLTLGLARELAPEVTVNAIAPGAVEWPDDYPQAEREKYLRRVPLGRAGTPDDVAKLVRFLVTDGSYITGQVLRLDGGRSVT